MKSEWVSEWEADSLCEIENKTLNLNCQVIFFAIFDVFSSLLLFYWFYSWNLPIWNSFLIENHKKFAAEAKTNTKTTKIPIDVCIVESNTKYIEQTAINLN